MKRSMCVFAVAAVFVLGGVARGAADFTVGFEAPAAKVYGQPGAVKTFDVYATLATAPTAPKGSSGWSLSVGIDAGVLTGGTLDDCDGDLVPETPKPRATITKVSATGVIAIVDWTEYERDADCNIVTDLTDPDNPIKIIKAEHLAFPLDIGSPYLCTAFGAYQKFSGACFYGPSAQMGGTPDPCGTKHLGTGAYEAIILRQDETIATTKGTTSRLVKLTVKATIPETDCVDLTLFFKDGYKTKDSQPQTNVVTVGTDTSKSVEMAPLTIQLCPAPVDFAYAAVPAGGTPPASGDATLDLGSVAPGVVPVSVDVLLTSSGVPGGVEGPPAWSLSIKNEACTTLDSVTLKGVTVNALAGAKDPLPVDLSALVAPAVNTALVAPDGAVSQISMGKSGTDTIFLHTNVTDKVLKLVYKITVAAGDDKTCLVSFVDGVNPGSGPVNNLVSWGTVQKAPVKIQNLVIKVKGTVGPKDGAPFKRGDANGDSKFNIADAVRVIMAVVPGLGTPLLCRDSGDVDTVPGLGVTDAVYIIDWQFRQGPPPPMPWPECAKGSGVLDTTCPDFPACP